MSKQETCGAIHNAISSPASEGGHSLSSLLGGEQIGLFGQEAVPASHSVLQDAATDSPTTGTCGPNFTASLASAALQSFLENRLQARLPMPGSTLYKQTWKPWVTPSGLSRSRLRASAHRTSGTGLTGWPMPRANDAEKRGLNIADDPRNGLGDGREPVGLAHSLPTGRPEGWSEPGHRSITGSGEHGGVVYPVSAGLEGYAGHGDNRDEPGRLDAQSAGSTAAASGACRLADAAESRHAQAGEHERGSPPLSRTICRTWRNGATNRPASQLLVRC
jgi:hypothetical protein